jgi:hypothetical protein
MHPTIKTLSHSYHANHVAILLRIHQSPMQQRDEARNPYATTQFFSFAMAHSSGQKLLYDHSVQ